MPSDSRWLTFLQQLWEGKFERKGDAASNVLTTRGATYVMNVRVSKGKLTYLVDSTFEAWFITTSTWASSLRWFHRCTAVLHWYLP